MRSNWFSLILNVVLALAVIAVLWQLLSALMGTSRFPDLPQTLSAIQSSFFHDSIIEAQGGGSSGYSRHVLATTWNFVCGFCLGSLIGFILAIVIAQSKLALVILDPLIEFFRVMPPLLVIPFAVLLFSSTETLPAFAVALYSAFTVGVYCLNALANVQPNYKILARLLGASRVRQILDVQIPAVLPELLGALRVSVVLSLGISVVTEYMAAPAGIGRVMKFAISFSRVDLLFVGIVWVLLIVLSAEICLGLIFYPLLRWTQRERLLEITG